MHVSIALFFSVESNDMANILLSSGSLLWWTVTRTWEIKLILSPLSCFGQGILSQQQETKTAAIMKY